MTQYIIRKYLSSGSHDGRKRAGMILGTAGIAFDLLLFITKHIAGMLSGSIAVTADAYNNLADAGAHIPALLAFPLGSRKPSKRFPFGCGRLEYFSGLIIAAAVFAVGWRMLASSADKILHPASVESSPTVIVILLFSIAVKSYMYCYNKRIGERIDSAGLRSVAIDSVCDCFATAAIIVSMLIQKATGLHIDGWAGMAVAGCILFAGIAAAKDSITPLLGVGASVTTLDTVYGILEEHPQITAVGDIAVHDYGPNRKLLTMRIGGVINNETVDEIKKKIDDRLGMESVIEIKEILHLQNNRTQSRQE